MSKFNAITPDIVVDVMIKSFIGGEVPTPDEVKEAARMYLSGPFSILAEHEGKIVDEVLQRIKVRVKAASVLDDSGEDHIDWLNIVDKDSWCLWKRLKKYLWRFRV